MTESASQILMGASHRLDRPGEGQHESVVIPTETWLEVVRLARLGSKVEHVQQRSEKTQELKNGSETVDQSQSLLQSSLQKLRPSSDNKEAYVHALINALRVSAR